jgi:hypothetical protein
MSDGFRWEIEAFAGPAREAMLGGARLLVRVRLFDAPGDTWPTIKPDAFTDLRPENARDLAFELLAAAEHAELITREADYWWETER